MRTFSILVVTLLYRDVIEMQLQVSLQTCLRLIIPNLVHNKQLTGVSTTVNATKNVSNSECKSKAHPVLLY